MQHVSEREPATAWNPVLTVRNLILQQQVVCSTRICSTRADANTLSPSGCDWKGKLEHLQQHLDSDCQHALVQCQWRLETGCDCKPVPRSEQKDYFYARAGVHLALLREQQQPKRKRRAVQEPAAAAAALSPNPQQPPPQQPPPQQQAPPPPPVDVPPPLQDAPQDAPQDQAVAVWAALAQLISSSSPDGDLTAVNSALERVCSALPPVDDESDTANKCRHCASTTMRDYSLNEFIGARAQEAHELEYGRQSRSSAGPGREDRLARAQLCQRIFKLLDGPAAIIEL